MAEMWHHGILGQRWGVKNGPPYPLGEGQKSKTEKQANQHKGINVDTDVIRNTAIAIGVVAAVTALGSYGGNMLSNVDMLGKTVKVGKLAVQNIGNMTFEPGYTLDALKRLKKPETLKNSILNATAHFDTRNQNCMFATLSAEMRQRGFDVSAWNTKTGITVEKFTTFFSGFDSDSFLEHMESPLPDLPDEIVKQYQSPGVRRSVINDIIKRGKIIEKALGDEISKKFPDNSRGALFATLSTNNHAMFWSKENGVVTIYDPWSANRNKFIGLGLIRNVTRNAGNTKLFGIPMHKPEMSAMRLDNLELRADTIMDIVQRGFLKV